ncbi:MAG TPA: GDP-mannose 4,6-dehydratase [Candidatus Omnitrophota bacterium]|nr:GDP-mannose 4,6-dehydratase [Candidatus Omnitrophota bacterium]HPD84114.1 GDP-mannose 4,6-dehydratase [Candidatus Omnitrophota bacterium]HRZ02971.1 GDP-mannose 4,6-dehydratase [Candidatus Omnitrophota bacterium]
MENLEKLNKKFWKNRKVLVTGPTGIVGSWLVKDLLALSAKVVVLIRDIEPKSEFYRSGDVKRVTAIYGKLEDFGLLKRILSRHKIDTVFHLAAQAIVDTAYHSPLATFESNIRGTYNLLEACRIYKNSVRQIIIASSDKAYGEQPRLPYKENMPLRGRYPYEVSKSCADLLAQSYYHTYDLPVVIVRCGNIYGGGDLNWSRIVPATIRSLLENERPIIRSDGSYIRDYIYVKDVCRAYIYLAQNLKNKKLWGEAFNISNESPLTVMQLVKIIQKLMGCSRIKPKIINCAKGEIHSQHLSSAKIRKMVHWKPQFGLKSGLTETIRWYDDFLSKKQ